MSSSFFSFFVIFGPEYIYLT